MIRSLHLILFTLVFSTNLEGQTPSRPSYIGVTMEVVSPVEAQRLGIAGGVRAIAIVPSSPALESGIQIGDILTRLDGRPVKTPNELIEVISPKTPGTVVNVDVLRAGALIEIPMKVAAKPTQLALTSEPILRLNYPAHTSQIYRAATDDAERFLATTSNDMTVKLWDLPGKTLLRNIRLPSDQRGVGRPHAVALSPDGLTLVVGVSAVDDDHNSIFVIDTTTGKLRSTILKFTGQVQHLIFSPGGQFLAACLAGEGVRIFTTTLNPDGSPGPFVPIYFDKDYDGADCYWGDWARSNDLNTPNHLWLATAAMDGHVRLYDVSANAATDAIAEPKPIGPASITPKIPNLQPTCCAFSPDGTRLAVSYWSSTVVNVYSTPKLKQGYTAPVAEITSGGLPSVVEWSKDGSCLLAAGAFHHPAKPGLRVLHWENGGLGPMGDWEGASDLVTALVPLNQGYTLLTSSDPLWTILDPQGSRVASPQGEPAFASVAPIANFSQTANQNFALSHSGSEIVFDVDPQMKVPLRFSLDEMNFVSASEQVFRPILSAKGLNVQYWRGNNVTPSLNGVPFLLEEMFKRDTFLSMSISPKKDSFILGSGWFLQAFDRTGKRLWAPQSLHGARAVNISGDGRIAGAACQDSTIRWFRMSDGKPILTLFLCKVNGDWQWICWTPEGFYRSSDRAEEWIGWQVNNGPDVLPEFYSAAQLYELFRDSQGIIPQLVHTEKSASQVVDELVKLGRMSKMPTLEEALQGVPTVSFVDLPDLSEWEQQTRNVTVQAHVSSPSESVTSIALYSNGKRVSDSEDSPLYFKDGIPTQTFSVTVKDGRTKLTAIALNSRKTASIPATAYVDFKGILPTSDLWIFGVAIEDYELTTPYCLADVQACIEALEGRGERIFREKHIVFLKNKEATRRAILDSFAELANKVRPQDTIVFIYAGHGAISDPTPLRDPEFHLVPFGADKAMHMNGQNRIPELGIPASMVRQQLIRIKAERQLVLLDTCHAGAFGSARAFGAVDKSIFDLANSAGTAVLASCGSAQLARADNTLKHGYFTYAFLEALRDGKADANEDGQIFVDEISSYIRDRVPALCRERTQPEQRPERFNGGQDFPLGVSDHL